MPKRMVTLRLTDEEYEALKARATDAGVSMEAYLRAAAEGRPFPPRWAGPSLYQSNPPGLSVAKLSTPGTVVEPTRPLSYAEQLRVGRGEKL